MLFFNIFVKQCQSWAWLCVYCIAYFSSGALDTCNGSEIIIKFRHILKERRVIFSQFTVCQNGEAYRTTQHPFKIVFQFSIVVLAEDDPSILKYGFHFCSFNDITSRHADLNFLIGNVVQLKSSVIFFLLLIFWICRCCGEALGFGWSCRDL